MEIKIVKSIRRSVSITVYRSCLVKICAPIWLSDKKIHCFIEEKRDWIERKLEKFKNQKTVREGDFQDSSFVKIIGNKYEIVEVEGVKTLVEIRDLKLIVCKKKELTLEKVIEKWKLDFAKDFFLKRLEVNFAIFSSKIDCNFPILKIRKMRARWGSMSSKGIMTLNLSLIEKEIDCIDYVIMHELCHIAHQDHSKKFYDLQESFTPNYKQIKAKLNA